MFWKQIFRRDTTGARGEDLAATYMQENGYTILERNWRNKKGYQIGEIDIVATKDGELIFIEVKSGLYNDDSDPMHLLKERITKEKLRKMERIAHAYMYYKDRQQDIYRFDAVLVSMQGDSAQIQHIENIFL